MPSILIIEDGTGVEDANSYATAAQARAYAALRGLTLPDVPSSGVDPVETLLVAACDYLQAQSFIGVLADPQQALAWPRVFATPYLNYAYYPGAYGCGNPWPIDASYWQLPPQIIAAQCQLVIEKSVNNIDLLPSTVGGYAGQFVTREKVDEIETSYSEQLGTLTTPTMRSVNAILNGLTVRGGGNSAIRAVRV